MVGFTPVSSPASMHHPVSEDQMNHFHCTDALLTDRLSWSGSSAWLAPKLTARSGETALSSAQDGRRWTRQTTSEFPLTHLKWWRSARHDQSRLHTSYGQHFWFSWSSIERWLYEGTAVHRFSSFSVLNTVQRTKIKINHIYSASCFKIVNNNLHKNPSIYSYKHISHDSFFLKAEKTQVVANCLRKVFLLPPAWLKVPLHAYTYTPTPTHHTTEWLFYKLFTVGLQSGRCNIVRKHHNSFSRDSLINKC